MLDDAVRVRIARHAQLRVVDGDAGLAQKVLQIDNGRRALLGRNDVLDDGIAVCLERLKRLCVLGLNADALFRLLAH